MSIFSHLKYHRINSELEFIDKKNKVVTCIVKEFRYEIDEYQERPIYIGEFKGVEGQEDRIVHIDGETFREI